MSLTDNTHISLLLQIIKKWLSFKADKKSTFNQIKFDTPVEIIKEIESIKENTTLSFFNYYDKQDLQLIFNNADIVDDLATLINLDNGQEALHVFIFNVEDHYELDVSVNINGITKNYAWGFLDNNGELHEQWAEISEEWENVLQYFTNFQYQLSNTIEIISCIDKNYLSKIITITIPQIENIKTTIQAEDANSTIKLVAGSGITFSKKNNDIIIEGQPQTEGFTSATISTTATTFDEYFKAGNTFSFKKNYDMKELEKIYNYNYSYDMIQLWQETKIDSTNILVVPYVSNKGNGEYAVVVRVKRGYYEQRTEYYAYNYTLNDVEYNNCWILFDEYRNLIATNTAPPAFTFGEQFQLYPMSSEEKILYLFDVNRVDLITPSNDGELKFIQGKGVVITNQNGALRIDAVADNEQLQNHIANYDNPHNVTPYQIGAYTMQETDWAVNSHNTSTTAHEDIRILIDDKISSAIAQAFANIAQVEEGIW